MPMTRTVRLPDGWAEWGRRGGLYIVGKSYHSMSIGITQTGKFQLDPFVSVVSVRILIRG
jgi:hypothetical protein